MTKRVRIRTWLTGLALAVAASSVGSSATLTWDVGSDYSVANGNPNDLSGPKEGSSWSYGTFAPLSPTEPDVSAFSLFSTESPSFFVDLGLEAWTGGGTDPNVSHNPTSTNITCCGGGVTWWPNAISISPAGAAYAGVRWTAPGKGTYQIATMFIDNQSAPAPVFLYHGATQVYSATTGTPVGAGVTNSLTVDLAGAGETIDFITGSGQNTALYATITSPSPDPFFVKSISPSGPLNRTNVVITVALEDNTAQVDPTTVKLYLNGQAVSPTLTKPAGTNVTALFYDPQGALLADAANTLTVIFGNSSILLTNQFSFGVIDEVKAANIFNVDINGARNQPGPDVVGPTFAGQGAAGGSTTFNGILADSGLPDGTDNDNLTVGGTNLLNSLGQVTPVSFTMSQVTGNNVGTSTSATSLGALLDDYLVTSSVFQGGITNAPFTISGLGTAPTVDLYLYQGAEPGALTVGGVRLKPTPFAALGAFSSGNTLYFKQIQVSGGQISGSLDGNPGEVELAGFTVVKPLPRPYVLSTAPTGTGVKLDSTIKIQLVDYVTQVAPATIHLFLNSQAVSPVITKPAGTDVTTVSYAPQGGLLSGSTNRVQLSFSDTSTPAITQTNEFTFVAERVDVKSWSATGDYSLVGNPNGAWSYGSMTRTEDGLPDVSSLTLYTDGTANGLGTPIDFWHTGGWDPNVTQNPTTNTYSNFGVTWQPGAMSLGPGFGGVVTAARWTAPNAALYTLTASFAVDQEGGDGSDVYIWLNNTLIFSNTLSTVLGEAMSFATNLSLASGDHLDFIVGAGADSGPTGNNTALSAVITTGQPFWSAAGDYSLAGNPNGPWSYGSMTRSGGLPDVSSLTLYTDGTTNGLGTPISFWHTGGWDPNVTQNPTTNAYSNFGVTWQPGAMSLGPGSGGVVTAVRWTAPNAGQYLLITSFMADQTGGDGSDVYIFQNTTMLFSNLLATAVGSGTNFETSLSLAQGDHLDFIVGGGVDDAPTGNNTELSATLVLTSPPAPSLKLSITGQGSNLVVSWSGAATLQSAAQLTGPWTDLAGQTSPYTFTPSGRGAFYRLRK